MWNFQACLLLHGTCPRAIVRDSWDGASNLILEGDLSDQRVEDLQSMHNALVHL